MTNSSATTYVLSLSLHTVNKEEEKIVGGFFGSFGTSINEVLRLFLFVQTS